MLPNVSSKKLHNVSNKKLNNVGEQQSSTTLRFITMLCGTGNIPQNISYYFPHSVSRNDEALNSWSLLKILASKLPQLASSSVKGTSHFSKLQHLLFDRDG